MRLKMLTAVLAAALVAVVAGATSAAAPAPPSALQIAPAALNFGSVAVDSSVTKTVTITNKTGDTLTYAGAHWPNFDNPVVGPGYPYGFWQVGSFDSCLTLAPKTSCTVEFQFKPFEAGDFNTHFAVGYRDGDGEMYISSIAMWGTGVAAAAPAPSNALQIAPAALNFGSVGTDSSVTRTVTITNKTGDTLTYAGAHWPNFDNPVVGPGYDWGFWQVGSFDSCLTLAPKTSCTVEFQFKPFEGGNFSTHFEVWYTDGVGGSYSSFVPMWGTGIQMPVS